jgi:hypothetical protein
VLRERAEEIEEDTPEAFHKRQQLVRLLVERITLNREGRDTAVEITYRFGPQTTALRLRPMLSAMNGTP